MSYLSVSSPLRYPYRHNLQHYNRRSNLGNTEQQDRQDRNSLHMDHGRSLQLEFQLRILYCKQCNKKFYLNTVKKNWLYIFKI